ncbi:ATP-dependent helicase [Rhodanobacter sp. MP7CTX1]|uniref:UvrD-helicase domain-containing protein n=1 Tax=Rhodanobacter sp. MP7CTX1 TaxID=2723084 RepID=UPI0016140E04|nr:ATP-dependent helicase [Rhodanobacter sp. MP7CTX1]MBB6186674.1 superfamily I DNA/RNA helicase [Rhodanobacter sp. MP7CTX1]
MFIWKDGDLNKEQEAAVMECGSVFLIACPGSGKTRALTYKIAQELSRLGTQKTFVVAITYTNRAADEIRERVEALGVDTSQLWIGTIHAFCLEWILKPYGIYNNALKHGFRVIDIHEREMLFEQLCAPYRAEKISIFDCDFFFTSEGYRLCCLDERKHLRVRQILIQYFSTLRENRQIDFEMILFYAHKLIKFNKNITHILSMLFSMVLVDEYQDTKEIQYAIVAAILKAGESRMRAFIVGDPNQAIYETLGGYPIEHSDFEAMAGIQLKQMSLTRNYRSSEKIIHYFSKYKVYPSEIESFSASKDYPSLISYERGVMKADLLEELVRLVRLNIESLGIAPRQICIVAPWWVQLAGMTRHLVARMPEYDFDGPGMVPFANNIENFWYKLSKIALTKASPGMYVRRLRWAAELLKDLTAIGVDISALTAKSLLRECNAIEIEESDGLRYLRSFFEDIFAALEIDFHLYPTLDEHHEAFFQSSQARIDKLKKDGAEFIGDIVAFRKVFQPRTGITISTIHGVKGAEFDTVISFALLEGMVPHFKDPNGQQNAKRMLYVLGSRARKNLHLISECGRHNGIREEYKPTRQLASCRFTYNATDGS